MIHYNGLMQLLRMPMGKACLHRGQREDIFFAVHQGQGLIEEVNPEEFFIKVSTTFQYHRNQKVWNISLDLLF